MTVKMEMEGKMGHGQKIEMAGKRVCGMLSFQRPLVRSATWGWPLMVGAEPWLGLFSKSWPRAQPCSHLPVLG